eukprot:14026090-Alexandrium_andersonii.AAC.1
MGEGGDDASMQSHDKALAVYALAIVHESVLVKQVCDLLQSFAAPALAIPRLPQLSLYSHAFGVACNPVIRTGCLCNEASEFCGMGPRLLRHFLYLAWGFKFWNVVLKCWTLSSLKPGL